MDRPIQFADYDGTHFVAQGRASGQSPKEIFDRLTSDFPKQSIFRKEQSFAATCILWHAAKGTGAHREIDEFLHFWRDAELPLLTGRMRFSPLYPENADY